MNIHSIIVETERFPCKSFFIHWMHDLNAGIMK